MHETYNKMQLSTLQTLTFYKVLAQHVFLILIFQYIAQNYILAELARMFLCFVLRCA